MKARLYDLIDRATSEYLSAPNFALNTDVISSINAATDPGYAACKACKRFKRRLGQKNPRVQQLTLQLLENCVRSCGDRFHAELAKNELFPELLRLADRTIWSSAQVQAQVLALLQEWAYVLRPAQFANAYSKLKAKGLPFPPPPPGGPGGAAAAPGGAFEPYPGLSPGPPGGGPAGGPAPPGGYGVFPGTYPPPPGGPGAGGASGAAGPRPYEPLSPRQQPEKIRASLEVARNTLSLFDDMLDGAAEEADPAAVRQDYITDMSHQVTAQMKAKLTSLIERVTDESILVASLELNDSTQRSLDHYADLIAAADGRRPRPPPRPRAAPPPLAPGVPGAAEAAAAGAAAGAAAAAAAAATTPPAKSASGRAAVVDLLSLDDWSPPPAATSAEAAGPGAAPEAAAPLPQRHSSVPELAAGNNPFAPAAAAAPAGAPPAPAAAAAAPAANPFLSDDSFAGAIQPGALQPPPPPALARLPAARLGALAGSAPGVARPPLLPAAAAGSGNPFAAAPARSVSFPDEAPALQPLGSADAPAAAAGTALYSTHSFSMQQAAAVPPPPLAVGGLGAGGAYPPPPPPAAAASPPGAYAPPVSPGFGTAQPAPAYLRPINDAFTDLLSLTPKRDEPPPPPRGAPMRASSAAPLPASEAAQQEGAAAPPPPAEQQPSPAANGAPAAENGAAVSTPPPAKAQAEPAGLSAFDAFDQLVASRITP
eukprot:scaffold11.g4035.t1